MSITLTTISSGYNLSAINDNFQSLQTALNNNILWRTGATAGEAKMSRDLDMDGHLILNLGVDVNNPDSLLTVEAADLRYYNVSGDTLEGTLNAGGNKLTNVGAPSSPSDASRKQDLDNETSYRQSADASLQQQIAEAAPIASAERPVVQWHGQTLLNSVTVPDNQNAFSIGPQIAIAPGQSVVLGQNSYWNILGNVFEADQLYNVTANNLRTSDGTHSVAVADIDSVITGPGAVAITSGSITGITDLAVADGGTGASTAAGARTNLGAAASGANTDITSITGSAATLTTARTIQTNLGSTSAASFNGSANVSPGVTGTLAITNGGTGATTAAAARVNLGAFGITGVTNGTDAAAGSVGEFVTATGASTGLTTGTSVNLTSISLTAGDWQVDGVIEFVAAAGTTPTSLRVDINNTSATPGTFEKSTLMGNTFNTQSVSRIGSPVVRFNISATTTIYLIATATFASGSMTGQGYIKARRIR